MRSASSCHCGRQLGLASRQQRSSWSLPAVLKKQPSRPTAHIAHSTDYSATATDEGILQLPPKQQLQEEDLVNVFNYERDLQGKCVTCLSAEVLRLLFAAGISISQYTETSILGIRLVLPFAALGRRSEKACMCKMLQPACASAPSA